MTVVPAVEEPPNSDASAGRMTLDEAIRCLREDPSCAGLVEDAYLGRDVRESAVRFARSAEFAEVVRLIGPALSGAAVADIGAGVGIASYALLRAGASTVVAIEPDPSDEVGRGAIERLVAETSTPIEIVAGWGEALPLPDHSVDVVYSRQVLHHATDLGRFVSEVARVARPGGLWLACREHVVDDESQRQAFLRAHPVHRLAGGENAFPLPQYLDALAQHDLELQAVIGPWDSVINAFPMVRSSEELSDYATRRLVERLGPIGKGISQLPGASTLAWRRIRRPQAGRLYSFLCMKPSR
jgi:ubiquinone/menaquinone biosynthesis C-methylase UbiE